MMKPTLRRLYHLAVAFVTVLVLSSLIVNGQTAVGNFLSLVLGSASLKVTTGAGSPEASITAPTGSIYLRTGGAAGQALYEKESGSSTTGWVPVGGGLTTKTRTLTDAEILALPMTPITIVSAPGPGLMIQPIFAVFYAKTTLGAYTNLNASAYLLATVNSGPVLGVVPNDPGITDGAATRLTDLLGGTNNRFARMVGGFDTEDVDEWGSIDVVTATAGGTDSPLTVSINNGGSGVLTGGNAANSLTCIVYYTIVTVP